MHPVIFQEFESICFELGPFNRVLEIGITQQERSLLTLPSLGQSRLKVAVDLEEGFRDENFYALQGNANHLAFFRDRVFDLVLCNSTLEHDASFWLTLQAVRRVARPGALLIFGVPGYSAMGDLFGLKAVRQLAGLPWLGSFWKQRLEALEAGTPTLGLHAYPSDYYRFSEQAVKEVFLQGLLRVQTKTVMNPPRVIGWGFMPCEER